MYTSSQLLENINAALAAITYPNRPEGLYEPVKYVLALGGKRIRPVLTLLAYNLWRDDMERAMPAALGLETYHNYTLLHDDLMDRADIRRGHPTVHRVWDENTAILSGDTMLVLAYRLMQQTGNAAVLELFTRTALEIGEGQQYDMNFERRTNVTVDEYIEMIRLKTSVLLACAAKTGALLAGASDADADVLYRYAELIGLAFQLQDDFLDVYGDPAVFGKKIGGDILCGKKTFLLGQSFTKLFFLCGQSFGALLPDGFQPLLGNRFLSFDAFVGRTVQQVFTLLCGFKLRFQCGGFTSRNQHSDTCPDAQSYNQ